MTTILAGIGLHAIGASCASLCYLPQRGAGRWSWQTFWLAQALICWWLLPIGVAWLTIPAIGTVLRQAPIAAMWSAFGLGLAYGIGATAFGLAIRYVGYSLTYAIAVGLSCVLGTLLPSIIKGQLVMVFQKTGAGWIAAGLLVGIVGIGLCGLAGRFKERDHQFTTRSSGKSLGVGLLLCLLAGVLSAMYGLALDQGQPIADVAARYGAGHLQGNIIFPFANSGTLVVPLGYCLYLHRRDHTFGEYKQAGVGTYYGLAALTGTLWYAQFFFYGLAHTRMGAYRFTSWAIHMIMLVLFSALAGVALREWANIRPRTSRVLTVALFALVGAVLLLTYGNYQGNH